MLTKSDIKLIRSLSDKAVRAESGLFVVEGDKMVSEAISSAMAVERVFATPKSGLLAKSGIGAVEVITEKDMERISHLKTPSVSLALVHIPKYGFSADIFRGGLVLALDGVQDPGNLGTIIRIADWFGIADVVCSPATADWLNPKVAQATMGALFRVRLHYVPLAEALTKAAGAGAEIYGTFLDGENIYEAELSGKNGKAGIGVGSHTGAGANDGGIADRSAVAKMGASVIVMGNEGRGISPETERAVTRRLFIPPYPADRQGSESLNVAAATAIVCSEFRRKNL